MTPRRLFTNLLWLAFFLALSGCGASNNPPPSGSITLQTTSKNWAFTAGAPVTLLFQPEVVTVKDSNGIPLKGVNVILSLDLSAGTSTSPVMSIYLADPTTGQPVTPITTPTDVMTSNTGTIDLWVGMEVGGTSSYSGLLYAYSGSLMTTATFSTTCTAGTGTGAPSCT